MDEEKGFDFDTKCHNMSGHVHPQECCCDVEDIFQPYARAIPVSIDVASWNISGKITVTILTYLPSIFKCVLFITSTGSKIYNKSLQKLRQKKSLSKLARTSKSFRKIKCVYLEVFDLKNGIYFNLCTFHEYFFQFDVLIVEVVL